MRTFALVMSVCGGLLAQSPTDVFEKAPPAVEEALRARIEIFMAAHISGKFRAAEQVVHEDSQDIFYNSQKQRFVSYEIVRINYAENFTKATVVTAVEMDWVTARMGKLRVKPPLTTTWKVDNGQWWWYAVPQKDWKSPFGTMTPGSDPAPGVAPSIGPSAKHTVENIEALHKQVEVSKTDIALSSWQPGEDTAVISNKMLGDITLMLDTSGLPAGLTATLSRDTVPSGGTAEIRFKYQPPDKTVKTNQTVALRVQPSNQVFNFNLTFAVPPEFEKYLKKK